MEAAHTREASQSPGELVPMKNTKISESQWQLTVGAKLISEHETVPWAVHWLQVRHRLRRISEAR